MTLSSPTAPFSTALSPRHLLLAIAIMAVWGSNFVVIKLALAHLPPLLLAALRFTLVLIPAAFFLRRPAVSWGNLAAYGLLIGVGQFGVLFVAMRHDITIESAAAFIMAGLALGILWPRVVAWRIARIAP